MQLEPELQDQINLTHQSIHGLDEPCPSDHQWDSHCLAIQHQDYLVGDHQEDTQEVEVDSLEEEEVEDSQEDLIYWEYPKQEGTS